MFSPNLQNVNLASNFLFGNVPEVPSNITSDFRFNYFSDCHESCCLLNVNCTSQCSVSSERVSGPLPLGVEKSEWTEMDVVLLGVRKRIIQIETHFSSSPHFMRSYACPNTSVFEICNTTRINIPVNEYFGVKQLEMDVLFSASQKPNTYQKYVYFVQGDVCATNVKVHLCWNICLLSNNLL